MATAQDVADFLNETLEIDAFEDDSHNGLQVDGPGRIKRVCCGVDASMEFFCAAHARGADFLVCHHGISWGESLKRITGMNYERIAYLVNHGMALYACHLPLDAHARYGNNAQIVSALKLRKRQPFGDYRGMVIGYEGELDKPMRYATFKKRVAEVIGAEMRCMDFGPPTVKRVAVVSGGAADGVHEAGAKGVDVYITGEPRLEAYAVAQELGVHVIFAGHYATEVFGVKALMPLLRRQFGVTCDFVDLKVEF